MEDLVVKNTEPIRDFALATVWYGNARVEEERTGYFVYVLKVGIYSKAGA